MWDKLNRYRELFSSPSGYLDPEYDALQEYLQDVMGGGQAGHAMAQAMPSGLYASAAVDYGMDVHQVNQVLQQQMGLGALTANPAEIRDTLGAYVQARGGSPPLGTSTTPWQMMHGSVGYHSAMGAAKHLNYKEEPPAGYVQYENIAYPYERLSSGLGWTVTPEGQLEVGLAEGKFAKLPKRSREMQQRESAWFSGVPVQQSSILAQGANIPEQLQRVQAFVSVGQDLPEGAGYFDPSLGRATGMIKRQYRLPEDVDPASFVAVGDTFSGNVPLTAFAGHRGERFPQYEQLQVANVDVRQTQDKYGKSYSEMVLQMQTHQPMGPVAIKSGGGKVGAVPMPGLQENLGADVWLSMNEPHQMAAWIMGGMTQGELQGALGYAPDRLTPGVAREFYHKYMLPRVEQRWLPGRFRADDPRFQARQEAGTVRNVEDVGGGWVTAEQRLTGFSTPIGIQPRTVWGYHNQLVKPEVYAALKRMPEYNELVSHYERRGQRSVAETQHIGAAALANAGVATGLETVAAGDVMKQMPTFAAQAIGMLREQGKVGPNDEPAPGLYAEALMETVGQAYKGKGIQFGELTLPNPQTVLHRAGRGGIEGQIFGLSSAYADLMQTMEHAEANPVRYAEAVSRAQTAFLGDNADNPGLVRGRGFRDEFWGLPTSGGLSGGRVTPMEDIPINRFAMGREQLLKTLQTRGISEGDATVMVEDMFSGKMKQDQLPRALAFGYPLTSEEEQLSIRLGWAGPQELGMSDKAYEAAFGSSTGMHPVVGAALGRDFDIDPYAFLQGTEYSKRRSGGWRAQQMAGGITSSEEIIRMARTRTPAELGPDIEKIKETGSYYEMMKALRGTGSTVSKEDTIAAFSDYSTGKEAMAPAYQFGLRTLKWALGGNDSISRQARNELGIPYGKAQDIEGAGPAWTRLQDYYRSLGLAKWGARGEDERIYAKGPSHLLRDIFDKTAALTDFSPETRAALLMYPGREGFEKMPGLMEKYNTLTGEGKGIEAAQVMGKMFQTAAYGGDLWKWAQEGGPLGYSIVGMAALRSTKKIGDTWTTPSGRQMSFNPTGKLAENLSHMAEQGGAVRGVMKLLKSGEFGNMPFHEAVQAVQHAEATGARIDPALMDIYTKRVRSVGVPSSAQEAQVDRLLGALDFSGAGDPAAVAQMLSQGPQVGGGARQWDAMPKFPVESVSLAQVFGNAKPASIEVEASRRLGQLLSGKDMASVVDVARKTRLTGQTSPFRQALNQFVADKGPEAQQAWRAAVEQHGLGMKTDPVSGAMYHDYAGFGAGGAPPNAPPPTTPAAAAAPPAGGSGGQGGGGGQQGPGGIQMPMPMQAAAMAASGAMQGLRGRVSFGQDEATGQMWTHMNVTPPQKELTALQRGIIERLKEYGPKLKDLVESTDEMSKQYRSSVKILGRWHQQLRQATVTPAVEGSELARMQGAGVIETSLTRIEDAFGGKRGLETALANVDIRQDLSTMFPTQQSGLQQAFGAFKKLAIGWTPMQMSRVWGMTGAPVFNQLIPAAAQAEMAGWRTAQAFGGTDVGLPGGMAGELMQHTAARRQGMIDAGRIGYQAWGWMQQPGIGTALNVAKGIAGPAAGAGLVSAIGLNALGSLPMFGTTAAALAMPVGLGIAAAGTAIGTGVYAHNVTDPGVAANQIGAYQNVQQGGFGGNVKLGARYAGTWFTHMPTVLGQSIQDGTNPWRTTANIVAGEAAQGARIMGTPIAQLGTTERIDALSAMAQQLRGQEGTVWAGMDEGQILQTVGQYAPFMRSLQGKTADELLAPGGLDTIANLYGRGISPVAAQRFAATGRFGSSSIEHTLTAIAGMTTTDAERIQMESNLGLLGPLGDTLGMDQDKLLEMAGGGGYTGAENRFLERLGRGDPMALSRMARAGGPSWMEQRDVYGMQTGQRSFAPLLRGMQSAGIPMSALGGGSFSQTGLMQYYGGAVPLSDGNMFDVGVGGLWGLQDWQTAENRSYQAFQMQQSQQRWERQGLHTMGGMVPVGGGIMSSQGPQMTYQRGTWDIQADQLSQSRAYQGQMWGIQGAQLSLSRDQTLTQLDWRGEDIDRGFERSMASLEKSAAAIGSRLHQTLTQIGWSEDKQRLGLARGETQFAWQSEDIGRQMRRGDTKFEWGVQDIALQRATGALQFGWQMEDFDENIRFAGGRQRKRMMTQRERATTMYGIEEGQRDTELDRLKERKRWTDEDHATTLRRLEEKRNWMNEDHDTEMDHLGTRRQWAAENAGIESAQIEERREQLIEDHEREVSRHDQRVEWAKERLNLSEASHAANVANAQAQAELQDEATELQKKYWKEQLEAQGEALQRAKEHRDVMQEIEDNTKTATRGMQLFATRLAELLGPDGDLVELLKELAAEVDDQARSHYANMPIGH